jgi:hypothetical protein
MLIYLLEGVLVRVTLAESTDDNILHITSLYKTLRTKYDRCSKVACL